MAVAEDEQLMVVTRQGVVNRQRVNEISLIGRATQGVKLVNLDEGDTVVDVARIVTDEEAVAGVSGPDGGLAITEDEGPADEDEVETDAEDAEVDAE
jgi:DNA gyrase subunit A